MISRYLIASRLWAGFQIFVYGLHVLPVPVWVSSSFLPQAKNMHIRLLNTLNWSPPLPLTLGWFVKDGWWRVHSLIWSVRGLHHSVVFIYVFIYSCEQNWCSERGSFTPVSSLWQTGWRDPSKADRVVIDSARVHIYQAWLIFWAGKHKQSFSLCCQDQIRTSFSIIRTSSTF